MSQTIIVLWYTTNANPETQIAERRRNAPWYTTKTDPSTMDMLYTARETLTTHRINTTTPGCYSAGGEGRWEPWAGGE